MKRVALVAGFGCLFFAGEAEAIRFNLGLAGQITPVVVDDSAEFTFGEGTRLGLLPVLEFEVLPWLAFDTYAPFTLYRTNATGPASSGGESVFGLGASLRKREVDDNKIETLVYGRLRGGFGTQECGAGIYSGVAAGYAQTWLNTGRGWFVELDLSWVDISPRTDFQGISRITLGASLGISFRLGGERWDL
ncbi:MAG: hypothetical protein VYC39_05455 [Myxococcota bacterium]|nr:hypothetical protein [Myxococcota bacterium]